MAKEYKIMTGNEACTLGALAAGMNFFAGYPITPATEIAELASELLPKYGGKYMQMEDELASMAAVIGASAAGAKAMTATSGPGVSLMQENLGYGMSSEIPCVLVDVMRQGPCQGAPTSPAQGDFMQARWGTHGDHPVIVLVPSSVSEVYTEIIRAFNLAERFRTPVFLLSDATLAHMSEKVCIPDPSELTIVNRKKPECDPADYLPFHQADNEVAPMATFGDGYRWFVSGIIHDDTGFPAPNDPVQIQQAVDHLLGKISSHISEIESYEEYLTEDAEIIMLSAGLVSRCAKSAVDAARREGIKAGLFRPITLWPFPEERFSQLCSKAKVVMTCEMSEGQLSEVAAKFTDRSQKLVSVTQSSGAMIMEDKILKAIKEVI